MKFISHLDKATPFEKHYNKIRHEEGRLLSLEQIRRLPQTDRDFEHHKEWNIRQKSTNRIIDYLTRTSGFSLLDLGCGNGWFLNKLTSSANRLMGIDINLLELEQAAEILSEADNLSLNYGDIFKLEISERFDYIVLNGSVQYFPSLSQLLNHLLSLLAPGGEIHLVDSPFYQNAQEATAARDRSKHYFRQQGVDEMSAFYHHHTFEDLKAFDFQVMYNPHSMKRKILRKFIPDSPLYWIKINNR